MLNSEQLTLSAVKHFPRWTDIRKRYFSSNGGKLVSSIAKEVEEIQSYIDEYVKEFFIPYYEDKCSIIPDFIHKANIGIVDINELELVSPLLEMTTDIKEFYSSNKAYYQDGFIFVREYVKSIFYSVNGTTMEAFTEPMHVWSVYDEFAAFIGIERYEGETNSELYNRILNTANKVINSSEDGLKNAITSSLVNIIPELENENIKLERPTVENLSKYYDEFNTVLDKLISVNKDVLKAKKWDVDKWSNDFKQIDFVPHKWDVLLDDYTNGIGDNDDLKVQFIENDLETSAVISFYEKSEDMVDSYIRNNNIEDTLNLSLKKYNNVLNPYTAKYKITASEAREIVTTENSINILVDVYETLNGVHNRSISELAVDTKDIEIINPGTLEEGKYYRVKFLPNDKYESMEIYECQGTDSDGNIYTDKNGDRYDFKYEKDQFKLENNILYNSQVKKSAKKISDYSYTSNATNVGNGITIGNIEKETELVLEADKCQNEYLKIVYDCEMSRVPLRNIDMQNFFYNKEDGMYMSNNLDSEKTMTIKIEANQFSVNIAQGQCHIIAFVNGENVFNGLPTYSNGVGSFSTKRYNNPEEMEITIIGIGISPIKISELLYSKFSVTPKVAQGVLFKDSNDESLFIMPPAIKNTLTITMQTYTQYSPIIRKVFIGKSLDESNAYVTDLIKGIDGINLSIKSNCKIVLYSSNEPFGSCDENDPKQTVSQGYSTEPEYVALNDDAYIVLDLSEYSSINSIDIDDGTYESNEYGKFKRSTIRLKTGQRISDITIEGSYTSLAYSKNIHELIKNVDMSYTPYIEKEGEWTEGDKLFVSKMYKSFIIEKSSGEQRLIDITKDSFKFDRDISISQVSINNIPDGLQACFISSGYENINNINYGAFDKLYIYPKNSNYYVARNEYSTYVTEISNIEIVNTFNNGYIDNTLMTYKIEPESNDFSILFDNGKDWSVGKRTMGLILKEANDFNFTRRSISEQIKLGDTVALKEVYVAENKELLQLDEFIIEPNPKYEVVYKYDVNDEKYDKAEYISIKKDGFNKLKYSNIVAIKYIGKRANIESNSFEETAIENMINDTDYELDKEKGIIIWKNKELINSQSQIYIIYTIKKAIAVKYDIDYLYDKVQRPVLAYNKLDEIKLDNLKDGSKIDLLNPNMPNEVLENKVIELYKKKDIIYISYDNPNFMAEKTGSLITFKKVATDTTLAVKAGWYYMYGREYYLFATNQSENIVDDEYVTTEDIEKTEDKIYLHKDTNNYIKNSKMVLSSLANTYSIKNFNTIKDFKGSSRANSITACDSYNYWNTFAMDVSLKEGLNGLGLYFVPNSDKDISYATLDITNYLEGRSHISYYNPDDLKVYIGIEESIKDISLTDTTNITSMTEVRQVDGDIHFAVIDKEEGKKYYLVVRGTGLLDDIIIQDATEPNYNLHTKNIKSFNLDIKETTTANVISRLLFTQGVGNKNNGSEIDRDGFIVNASSVDWGVTKVKSLSTEKDWLTQCVLTNVDIKNFSDTDSAVVTVDGPGRLVTKAFYIGDINTIKSVIYKINDIPIKAMNGFSITLLQGQTSNSQFIECKQALDNDLNNNYSTGLIYPYIKLVIDMPKDRVVKNIDIYVEYKSTNEAAPNVVINSTGSFISKIYDSHHSTTYKVKSVWIDKIEGVVNLSIRGAKESSKTSVWTPWHNIELDLSNNVVNDLIFEDYRYFQLKVDLLGKQSQIKIKHIDLEVKK